MKECNKCHIIKEETEFYKDKSKKDGIRNQCKMCEDIRHQKRYKCRHYSRYNIKPTINYDNILWHKNKLGYYTHGEDNKTYHLHRYIWQKYNGNIPSGYCVHHKDENKDNNDISNLELLQAAEHSRKHSTGRLLSKESKAIIGIKSKVNMKKLWQNKEYREKQCISHIGIKNCIGIKRTQETKQKISDGLKKWWIQKKNFSLHHFQVRDIQ